MSEENGTGETPSEETPPPEGTGTILGGASGEQGQQPPADQEPSGEPQKGESEGDKPNGAYWPEDWREKMAENASAGDSKAYDKELRRLQRFADPSAIYGSSRELEAKFTGGGLVKIPGENASESDVKQFHEAMGVPETPEGYFDKLELSDGAVIGEADRPMANSFAEHVHKTGATPQTMSAAMDWYHKQQEQHAAESDAKDHQQRAESIAALKEEFGAGFERRVSSVNTLFATAKGGASTDNPDALMSRLMGGRMSDGSIIGNDPDMVRWLSGMAQEVNPMATVVDTSSGNATMDVESELKKIDQFRRENKAAYYKDESMQARERELLAARERYRAKHG